MAWSGGLFAECAAEYSSSGAEEQGLDVGEGADVVESIEAAIFIFFVNQSILFLTKKMYERKEFVYSDFFAVCSSQKTRCGFKDIFPRFLL